MVSKFLGGCIWADPRSWCFCITEELLAQGIKQDGDQSLSFQQLRATAANTTKNRTQSTSRLAPRLVDKLLNGLNGMRGNVTNKGCGSKDKLLLSEKTSARGAPQSTRASSIAISMEMQPGPALTGVSAAARTPTESFPATQRATVDRMDAKICEGFCFRHGCFTDRWHETCGFCHCANSDWLQRSQCTDFGSEMFQTVWKRRIQDCLGTSVSRKEGFLRCPHHCHYGVKALAGLGGTREMHGPKNHGMGHHAPSRSGHKIGDSRKKNMRTARAWVLGTLNWAPSLHKVAPAVAATLHCWEGAAVLASFSRRSRSAT